MILAQSVSRRNSREGERGSDPTKTIDLFVSLADEVQYELETLLYYVMSVVSTYTHTALQVFVYALGTTLLFIWLFTDLHSQLSIGLTTGSLLLSIFQPIILGQILKDKVFILFEFVVLCASTASLVWTQSKLPAQAVYQVCTNTLLM